MEGRKGGREVEVTELGDRLDVGSEGEREKARMLPVFRLSS